MSIKKETIKEENQLIHVIDESGDKEYFTMIPNYILNHSTANAQALYLQLKRLAGDNGVAYPGNRYLMKQLGLSYPTLQKELKYLIKKEWIRSVGNKIVKTKGGEQTVSAYKITNLWDLNSNYYKDKRDAKIESPNTKGGKQGDQK